MFKSHKITCFCLILLALLAFTSQAQGVSVPFVPSDLSPGDEYHVVFFSEDTTEATSTDIDDYNAFAQDQGDLDIPGSQTKSWGVNWFAIASTSTVNAKDNIPVTDAPIYLLTDVRVADNAADLWDGSIATAILVSQGGGSDQPNAVWTGTAFNGNAFPSLELGSSTPRIGQAQPGLLGPAWVSNNPWTDPTERFNMYVVSEVLTVGDPGGTPPVADAGGPYSGTAGQSLGFDGSGSSDADGSIAQYDWNFGDGPPVNDAGPTPMHTYASSGPFTVTLTVTDNDGLTNSATTTATISAETPDPPQGLLYELSQPVGATGGFPDPDPFYFFPTEGSLSTRVVWEDNKQLEAGPGSLGINIHPFTPSAPPFFGVLLDAGLNPIAGTEFQGIANADEALINLAETTRFSGVYLGLGNFDGYGQGYMFAWAGSLTVVDGEAVGNQPPIAKAGPEVSGTEGVAVAFVGGKSSDPDGSIAGYLWDFGDGTTGTDNNPGHTYSEAKTYNVTLTVTDDQGAVDSDTTIATIAKVNNPPMAWAGGEIDGLNRSYTGTVGVPLQFDGSLSSDDNGIASYSWDWGENAGDPEGEGVTPQHTYELAQTYGVQLTVYDAQGESDIDIVDVEIAAGNRAPVADAGPPAVGTSGVAVQFNGSASNDPDGAGLVYDWDWDDGTQDLNAGSSPQHTYSTSGDYTVILTVTDADGISDSDTTAASIDPDAIAPLADAGGTYSGTAGVAVDFDGSASNDPDGTVVRYDWDFGDDTPVAADAGPAPSHTYADSGLYNVRLTVTDNDDLTNLDITSANIGNAANLPPTADAGGPYDGIVNQGIQFYGGNSSDPDGTIGVYEWDFGDGGTSSQLNPTHTYTTPGPHPVTLTVTDDDDAMDSDTAQVIVGATLIPPTAEADGPYIGEAGAPVTFDGTGSDDPDGSITDYDWTFGDGNTGTGPTPDHTYGAGSRYHVTLQVTDDDGLPDADGTTVLIGEFSQPPTADAGGPYHGRVSAPVTLDGTASDDPDGDIVRYDWDFGDSTTVTDAGPRPDHAYAGDGRYRVALTVTDDSGETDRDFTVATIGIGNLPPEADAGDSVNGKVRRDITFDGTGSSDRDGNVVSYAWEFGDGNTDTGSNPTHSYADAGKYRVTMTVTDNDGATSSDVTLADVESKSGGGGGGGSCFINTMMGQ